ncbi:MAG: DUF1330 domain-containing protein [Proteobacteria bacterium]|nr:DUF1330 domain-containing protein [Pseudomonadota bacterium]
MSVYVIAQITIHDRERYAQYGAGFMDVLVQHGGELLVVDEQPQVLEGEWPHTRSGLLRFDTRAQLDTWYFSSAYQALAEHRWAASVADIAVLQGLPQP